MTYAVNQRSFDLTPSLILDRDYLYLLLEEKEMIPWLMQESGGKNEV
jgi:hypothetical protein